MAIVEKGLNSLESSLNHLFDFQDPSSAMPEAAGDYTRASFRRELGNLDTYFTVFPFVLLPNEFTDSLLDLLSDGKSWQEYDSRMRYDNLYNKIDVVRNLIPEIKKDFSQPSN